MPSATVAAAPSTSGNLDFDALLAPSAAPAASSPSAPAAPVAAAPLPVAQEAAPSWQDFAGSSTLYRDPIVCGFVSGAVLGALGVFVVLRRAVFVTAAVSQSAALGVALSFLLGIYWGTAPPPVLGALVLALGCTALLAWRPRSPRLPREALVGLLYVAASGLAVLVGDRITQEAEDVTAILFGTAVLVRPQDLLAVLVVSALVVAAIATLYRGLVFAGFDPEGARVQRLPVGWLELLLWVLVALEVSVTTRAVGALPVFAFSVLPAMAALRATERLPYVVLAAGVLGGLAGGLGYLAAFFLRFPVGASQAACAVVGFLLASGLSQLRTSAAALLASRV
ncbi:MAG TPA: metal ABC transporter permease [Polyangiaceae bacterium]|nr:metal ABC transporter permease [Polyangiaceae bacterium]